MIYNINMSSYIGIPFSIGAAFMNSIGFTIQKKILKNHPTMYFKYITWWLGFLMIIIAEISGGFAYAYLPVSIAISLSSLTILINGIISKVIHKVKLTNSF